MNKITMMEVIMLSVAVTVSTAVMFTPYFAAQAAGQDAWISVLVAGLLALAPAWAAGTLMARFPKQSIIQALPKLLGKYLGILVAVSFAGYFLFASALALWRLEVFTVRFLLPETPQFVIRALFLFCVACAAFSGSTPLIRTSAYIVPLGMLVIILVIALPLARMDPTFLLPVFESGYLPVLSGGFTLLGWLCQIPLVILMFQRYADSKSINKNALKALIGVAVSTFALELGAVGTLAVFGPRQTASMFYPAFEVARVISIGAFLERIEVIFVGVWIAGIFIAAAFYVQAFGDSVTQIFNFRGKSAKIWIYGCTTLILVFWPVFVSLSFLQIIEVIRTYGSILALVLGGVFPLVLLAKTVIIPPKEKDRSDESGPEDSEGGDNTSEDSPGTSDEEKTDTEKSQDPKQSE